MYLTLEPTFLERKTKFRVSQPKEIKFIWNLENSSGTIDPSQSFGSSRVAKDKTERKIPKLDF